ncbi:MAG: exodeoxyribonuclease VII small subunit [Thermoplasmatota archaeon]
MSARSRREGAEREPSFEDALAKLENIVRTLEVGDVRLEEALRLFEEGSALSKRCLEELDGIEKKLEEVRLVDGRVVRVPLEEGPRGEEE